MTLMPFGSPIPPWKIDSPGYRLLTHGAIGNNADVDGTGPVNSILQDILGVGTANSVLSVQEIMTGAPDTYNTGLQVKAVSNLASAAGVVLGAEIMGATASGNAQNVTILGGFFGGARHSGTGTATFAYGLPGLVINTSSGNITSNASGVYGTVQNSGTGTIGAAAGLHAAANQNGGGGTITTNYGLYIESQIAGTTNYNIYSAGGSADNYFAGYVRTSNTGGFYMNALGSINNRFKINEPTTANAAAECIITPSSTARIPMVYQGIAGQSADLNQWEDSTGAVLSSVNASGLFFAPDGSATTPAWSFTGDTNTGLYRPTTDQIGIATGGVEQAIFDGGGASASVLELVPSNRTVTATQRMILVDNTFTVDYASGGFPIGYDYGPTVIFNQNGYGFGSGFLFLYHPTIQNNSGSTRTIGPTGGFVSQPVMQANGGTLTPSYVAGLLSNATINRINSGATSVTSNIGAWVQGASVGAGCTLTNDIGFLYQQAFTNSGTWTNSAGVVVDAMTLGTNKTAVLLGTSTIPSGNWGIYQSSTTDNYFAGDIQIADGTAGGPSLTFASDTDTGLHYVATNQFSLDAGGLSRMQVSSLEVVVNPGKIASNDFKVHGDTVDNLIQTDASADALGFFNATPIARPTTAIAASTFVANTSGIANDTATFDGYTIGQVVKALRNIGILT